jgi:hypothetical protein
MFPHGFSRQISFAFCLLALCAESSSTQDFAAQRTPGALNMGSSLGYAAAFPIVREAPYTADVLTQQWKVEPDGRTVLHEAFNIHMRDAAGRVRDEQLASPEDEIGSFTQNVVRVIDPVSMEQTDWNNGDRTVFTSPIPPSFQQYRGGLTPCGGVSARNRKAAEANSNASRPVSTSLGVKTMEGLRVVGCRTTLRLTSATGASMTSTSEIWFSLALHIAVLDSIRYSDGSAMLTRLNNVLQNNLEPALFEPPAGYTKPGEKHSEPGNSNPNYAKIREYGHVEWHGTTAQLIAGGSRPLDIAALTLSSCFGILISAEDPHYNWLGDLLDVTAPQRAAQHSDHHMYAAKPGKVALSFNVNEDGRPVDPVKILNDAVDQVNQQQPWRFRLQHDLRGGHDFFSFVPTTSHNESGQLEQVVSWLDDQVAIASATAPVYSIAGSFADALSSQTGYKFSCCQAMVIGRPWGSQTMRYEATDQVARLTLEDLMIAAGGNSSYVQRCEPMEKRFCFINVEPALNRIPKTAPQSGVCAALGYDPD